MIAAKDLEFERPFERIGIGELAFIRERREPDFRLLSPFAELRPGDVEEGTQMTLGGVESATTARQHREIPMSFGSARLEAEHSSKRRVGARNFTAIEVRACAAKQSAHSILSPARVSLVGSEDRTRDAVGPGPTQRLEIGRLFTTSGGRGLGVVGEMSHAVLVDPEADFRAAGKRSNEHADSGCKRERREAIHRQWAMSREKRAGSHLRLIGAQSTRLDGRETFVRPS